MMFILTELRPVGKWSLVKAVADFCPVAREVVGPLQEAGLFPGVGDRVVGWSACSFCIAVSSSVSWIKYYKYWNAH